MDAEARFRALFDATYPAVARFARHRGLVGHDAEDLIAATYEVAWRRLDVVPVGDAAVPWLLTVALNHLRNLRRRQARDRALVERLPSPEQGSPPPEPSMRVGAIFGGPWMRSPRATASSCSSSRGTG